MSKVNKELHIFN